MSEIVIVIFVIFFLFTAGLGIATFIKNEKAPVVAVKARLVKKVADSDTSVDADGTTHTHETLWLHFELDTGNVMKFVVGGRVYRDALKDESGTLTYKGTRFLRFESQARILER